VAEVHEQSQKVGILKTSLGWRVYDIMSGRNSVTRSSVRGMSRSRIIFARGGIR
jgi:hypothetical protein